MFLLILSLLTLAVGPIVLSMGSRGARVRSALEGFTIVGLVGIIAIFVLPHAVGTAGAWVVPVLGLGYLLPELAEHLGWGHRHNGSGSGDGQAADAHAHEQGGHNQEAVTANSAVHSRHAAADSHAAHDDHDIDENRALHALPLLAGILGLSLHALLDGAALSAQGEHVHDDGTLLAIAVVLHRLPVGMAVWWSARPVFGTAGAAGLLGGVIAATIMGYLLGEAAIHDMQSTATALFEAFVAGSLLHVVQHQSPAKRDSATIAGGLLALGLLCLLLVLSSSGGHSH